MIYTTNAIESLNANCAAQYAAGVISQAMRLR